MVAFLNFLLAFITIASTSKMPASLGSLRKFAYFDNLMASALDLINLIILYDKIALKSVVWA
jgi:hypothetical protein